MNKQLFLTSSIHAVASDIASKLDLSKSNSLVFVTTAAEGEEGDKTWLDNDRKALTNVGFEVKDYTLTGKVLAEIKQDLSDFDYIYFSGGNTLYLFQKMKESKSIDFIRELVLEKGKTYIGTSAGTIAAAPKANDYLLEEEETKITINSEGLNLVDFLILPHWGSAEFKEKYLGGRLSYMYSEDQLPTIFLTDTQYIHVVGDNVKIIDTKHA